MANSGELGVNAGSESDDSVDVDEGGYSSSETQSEQLGDDQPTGSTLPLSGQSSGPIPGPSSTFTPNVLARLLSRDETGKDILKKAKQGVLSDSNQHRLADIVARYHLTTGKKLSADLLDDYANAIVSLLKREPKAIYYIPRGGSRKNAGGLIANRVNYLKQKARKLDLKESEHTKKLKVGHSDAFTNDETNQTNTDDTEWLLLNQQPWTTVLEKWNKSFQDRSRLLRNIKCTPSLLRDYPHISNEFGYQLVDVDFGNLYRDLSKGIDRLKHVGSHLNAYFESNVTYAAELFEFLESTNEDTRLCAVLLLLNTVFPPIVAANKFKPSIILGIQDTIIFAVDESQVTDKIKAVNTLCCQQNLPQAPKLVAIGTGCNNLEGQYLVVYGDVRYKFTSIARAVDVLIKFTAVFGLPYSRISKLVWHFLSGVVYNIPQSESYLAIDKFRKFLAESNILPAQGFEP